MNTNRNQPQRGDELRGQPANQCGTTVPRISQVETEYASLEKAVADLTTITVTHISRLDNVLRAPEPVKECGKDELLGPLVPMAEAIRTVRRQVEHVNSLISSATSRVEL